jgi:hypothetical protein
MSINDARYATLVSLGFTGQVNDMLLQYYLANGAVTPQINDAMLEFLVASGAQGEQVNDMWVNYLISLGYEGSINDMLLLYWTNGAT